MSLNHNKETSDAPLSEDEWIQFYRQMDYLENKVASGEELSKDEAEFFEKYHEIYQLHMGLAKHAQKIENLTNKALGEIDKINKLL